jgi:hypothetical protein
MEILGHKNIKNTLAYTHLVNFKTGEFVSKVAKTAEEAARLLEGGFEYVCTTPEDLMLFKKRKQGGFILRCGRWGLNPSISGDVSRNPILSQSSVLSYSFSFAPISSLAFPYLSALHQSIDYKFT